MPEKTVIAVPRESAPGETRVALTPDTVRRLVSDALAVRVEQGAGALAAFPDEAYSEAGADIVAGPEGLAEADIWVRVQPPREREDGTDEVEMIRSGGVLASFLSPAESPDLLRRLAERQVTALSIELLPRITRAQRMDALSAMSTVAGYKAVIIGADTLGKLFPLLITAAGTLSPAHVLVIGAGVAGLQAIATAHRLGAVVEAFDVRPAVKEQVESLGAKFVEAEEHEVGGGETEGGYAEELSEDEQEAERRLLAEHVAKSDVVITTALIPGKPAPLIITADMVRGMRHGSTIIDLAAVADEPPGADPGPRQPNVFTQPAGAPRPPDLGGRRSDRPGRRDHGGDLRDARGRRAVRGMTPSRRRPRAASRKARVKKGIQG
ncbi:MAG: NAD(P) transhydrogenase subunit alpha [Gemmatimonadales bacterium]